MTINMPIARIDNSNSANGSGNFRGLQKAEHVKNNPSFGAWVIKNPKLEGNFIKMGDSFPSWAQRLVSGVTGIMLQPWFDLNNKRVDEDTQKISTARTCAKIIAGTLTGVGIRWACVKATESFTRSEKAEKELEAIGKLSKRFVNKPIKKINQILLPHSFEKASFKEIGKYRQALGTYAGLVVMLFTNFLVDAPLTTYMTNKFAKKTIEKQAANKEKIEGGKQ